MDWEYYIDNDLSNAIIRAGVIWFSFRQWYKNIVNNQSINFREKLKKQNFT